MLYGASVKGTVTDASNGEPIPGSGVVLGNSSLGTTSSPGGSYEFKSLSAGTYVLSATHLGYVSSFDTVTIADSTQVLIHDIVLRLPVIVRDPYVEEYHARLQTQNRTAQILLIHIDCDTIREGFLTLHASMTNNSTIPFSVLRMYECINPIVPVVYDSAGTAVPPNLIRIDCAGEKIFPDRYDMIRVPEGHTIDYPPIVLQYYDFKKLPAGTYTISVTYRFSPPDALCCRNFPPDYRVKYADQIRTLNEVLRGEFNSSNTVRFSNRP